MGLCVCPPVFNESQPDEALSLVLLLLPRMGLKVVKDLDGMSSGLQSILCPGLWQSWPANWSSSLSLLFSMERSLSRLFSSYIVCLETLGTPATGDRLSGWPSLFHSSV